MTDEQIREALALAIGWHKGTFHHHPCWVASTGEVKRTFRAWNPLEIEQDTWTMVDALTDQNISPSSLHYNRGTKLWTMNWRARGPEIFESSATDASRRRAICLSALLILGIAGKEGGNHA